MAHNGFCKCPRRHPRILRHMEDDPADDLTQLRLLHWFDDAVGLRVCAGGRRLENSSFGAVLGMFFVDTVLWKVVRYGSRVGPGALGRLAEARESSLVQLRSMLSKVSLLTHTTILLTISWQKKTTCQKRRERTTSHSALLGAHLLPRIRKCLFRN